MSGVYTVPFAAAGVTTSIDLCEIVAHAARPLMIRGFFIGQKTEVGDTQEEMLRFTIKSGQTTSGSGGSATTPAGKDGTGVGAGLTAEQFNTTKASTGTIVDHGPYTWNVRMPYPEKFPEGEEIFLNAGKRATLELVDAPADAMDIYGHLVVQEIGG